MNRTNFKIITCLLALFLALQPTARAIIVYDPSNCAQNMIQALRLLQSNINEARTIANQVTSLANEAKNLTSMSWDIVEDFNGEFTKLFTTVGQINGLMQNVANLEQQFEDLYPDYANRWDPVSGVSMAEDMRHWLTATRDTMRGAAKTGAAVLEALPQTELQLQSLMKASQGSVGILQATQAGNQIAGTVAGQLLNLNAQLATYSQAHMTYLMELNSASTASRNRMNHVMDGWNEQYVGQPEKDNPF